MLVSCAIDCADSPVVVTLRSWQTDGVEVLVCGVPAGVRDPQPRHCKVVDRDLASVTLPPGEKFHIVIIVRRFTNDEGSVVALDDIEVSFENCPTPETSTIPPPPEPTEAPLVPTDPPTDPPPTEAPATFPPTTPGADLECAMITCDFEDKTLCLYKSENPESGLMLSAAGKVLREPYSARRVLRNKQRFARYAHKKRRLHRARRARRIAAIRKRLLARRIRAKKAKQAKLRVRNRRQTDQALLQEEGIGQWKAFDQRLGNRVTGIQLRGISETAYAGTFTRQLSRSILFTEDFELTQERTIGFLYYEATDDLTLKMCCDSENDCPWQSPIEAGPGPDGGKDPRYWMPGFGACPAGTSKLMFVCENLQPIQDDGNLGACGIDHIRIVEIPPGAEKDPDAWTDVCLGF